MTDSLAVRLHHLARFRRLMPHVDRHADCGCPRCRAHTWDHTGYPSNTMSDSIRSSDNTSSTERRALTDTRPLTYSFELAAAERALDAATIAYHNAVVRLGYDPTQPQKRGGDLPDPIPAGRGNCENCDTFVKGDGETRRLRAGLCHPCYNRYGRLRSKNPGLTVGDFVRAEAGHAGHAIYQHPRAAR